MKEYKKSYSIALLLENIERKMYYLHKKHIYIDLTQDKENLNYFTLTLWINGICINKFYNTIDCLYYIIHTVYVLEKEKEEGVI